MVSTPSLLSATAPITTSPLDVLIERIRDRSARVGILGLGYVGLPLAVEFASTFRVVGFDLNSQLTQTLNQGQSHVIDVPDTRIAELVNAKAFEATTQFERLHECDAIIICVPTPLDKDKNPDMSYIGSAAEEVASALRPGQIVILESTTYPGTTDELLLPLLQRNGLSVDEDFFLAFSPERVDPGNKTALRDIPKVVGGVSPASTRAACELYQSVIRSLHPVSSARVAETVKLLENTFRLVNIGMINEFAMLCRHLGIDAYEVIEGATTKPFGFMPFFPGAGAGGHCIPLDPLYLAWKARQQGFVSRFIELGDALNTEMPTYVVDLIAEALNDERKSVKDSGVLIIGVAYKEDIDDARQSPAIAVIDRLRARGANVAYHDPYVRRLDFDFHGWAEWRPQPTVAKEQRKLRVAADTARSRRRYDALENTELTPELLRQSDCVVILTKHTSVDYDMIAKYAPVVVDTRNALRPEQGARKVVRL